jgi:hypothetical protein
LVGLLAMYQNYRRDSMDFVIMCNMRITAEQLIFVIEQKEFYKAYFVFVGRTNMYEKRTR